MSLISNAAFKATQGDAPFKYLGVLNDGGVTQGYLEYSTDGVLTKNAKFALENASAGGFVHIRSCLTNKYWVRSSTTNGNWIVAQAVEPKEDQESWFCTLFRMDMDNDRKVTFRHVQSGNMVCIPNDGSDRKMFLSIDEAASTVAVSLAIDYDDFVVLLKFVAFKGSNDLYFKNEESGFEVDRHSKFSVTDMANPLIACETHYISDGNLRLKVVHHKEHDMFWSLDTMPYYKIQNVIRWHIDEQEDPSQMFWVIKIPDNNNVVALRNLGNNMVCLRGDFKMDTGEIESDRLVARGHGLLVDTYLRVVETVIKRTIYSVEFDLDKSRIYGVTLMYTDEHVWENPTDETHRGITDGRIRTSKSKTYTNSINVTTGVKTTFETGVPFIAKGQISVSASASYTHQWDSTETEEQQVGHIFEAVVVPRKITVARGTAARGFCDVPFAYVQKDYPASGGAPIITRLSDGVFKGANAYNFTSEVWYEDFHRGHVPSSSCRHHIKKYLRPASGPAPTGHRHYRPGGGYRSLL